MSDDWNNIGRLLVVCLDDGNAIEAAGPALNAIRRALPGVSVSLLVPRGCTYVARQLIAGEKLLVTPPSWTTDRQDGQTGGAALWDLVEMLRQEQFDAAIILTGSAQSPYPAAYVCYLADIPIRLGQSKEFGGRLLSHWVQPPADDVTQGERNLHLLTSAGVLKRPGVPLPVTTNEQRLPQ